MVSVTRSISQGELAPRVRIGVGGRWSAEELQNSLISFLESTGWQVFTRSASGDLNVPGSMRSVNGTAAASPPAGLVELVPLGDGLSQVAGLSESEELDAVVISPLAESDADAMTARRYLARFVRQLRPGGATIFAADDPLSDIFSAIRLDCRRLGYTFAGDARAWRTGDGVLPLTSIVDRGDTDPGHEESNYADRTRLELAAMVVVQAFGLGVKDTTGPISAFAS